jgi:phage baseplate assembly protein gpV
MTATDSAAIAFGAGGTVSYAGGSGTVTTASIAGTTQAAAINTRYIVANAGQTTITLPTTFAIGDVVIIKGLGAGGWILAAGTATTIRIGSSVTSSAGSLTSANQYDTVYVSGLVANTTWSVDYVLSAGLTVA